MDSINLDHLANTQLAKMLQLDSLPPASPPTHWHDADAAAVLRHQLAAPLLPDLAIAGAEVDRLESLVRDRLGAESFLRQLTFITPSLELLVAIKSFARCCRDAPENPLQNAPATVLYYAAIAAAMVRCKTRITQLSDVELRDGFAWAKIQSGAEPLIPTFLAGEEQITQR